MRRGMVSAAILLWTTLSVAWVSMGMVGEPQKVVDLSFEGYVKAIKIDLCGLQPGMCQGSMVLAQKEGSDVSLAIRPGMRIKHGEQLRSLDDLGAGDYVKIQAIQLARDPVPQIIVVEVMTP